ncbi:ABC transporter ATP-binding protein [Candidatus Fermentibacteria bacterium]|nr:ABC transporter ATP-binding protein [Candidatus Fermentibacteria bacterium]
MPAFLQFEGISKAFGEVQALRTVTLSIRKGEIFSLLGPSGCGKTTLLRVAAGFERPDEGRVRLDGEDITELPPNRRRVNTIFQNYALFPHLNVGENIAFGLRVAGRPRREVREEVQRMLRLVQMEDQVHKKPAQLSGGQKQRVAIARALINRPQVLLLDEPLAALDLKLRQRMLIELDMIHDEVGTTFLYVTHDQSEAMSLSDHIAVMNNGQVEQVGSPLEIYEAPLSSFTAAFIGDTNFFDGTVMEAVNGEYSLLGINGFPDVLCFNDRPRTVGDLVHLSLRPEKLAITRERPPHRLHHNVVNGVVEDVIYLGSQTKYRVRVSEYLLTVLRQHQRTLLDEQPITWDDGVWLDWHADDGYMLERYRERDEDLMSLPPNDSDEPRGE